jgi:hypothetical protein
LAVSLLWPTAYSTVASISSGLPMRQPVVDDGGDLGRSAGTLASRSIMLATISSW